MNFKPKYFLLIIAFLLLTVSLSIPEEKKEEGIIAFVGGTLIDGTGASPISNTVVLVQGKKIKAVGPANQIKIPEGAKRIDVSGKYLLPGFIDLHIHVTFPYSEIQYHTDSLSLKTLRAVHVMEMMLRTGVTSVRDVGAPVEPMQALLSAQKLGYIDTIRLFSCGGLITTTGGHGDGVPGNIAVDGPWEFRKAVREMAKAGFRHIKISPTYTLEEAKAAVDEANIQGMKITSHGGGLSDTIPTSMTRIAVEAGVACIEHLNEMDDNVLDLIAKKGIYIVPTLAAYRELYKAKEISRYLIEKRHWTVSMHETLFKKARDRKIIMGVGTDVVEHFMELYPGIYLTEMKYYVELGASPMETIVAATKIGALILGLADELGTIEAGKLADLQVISGDPLKSFDALGHPEIVMIGGKIHQFK